MARQPKDLGLRTHYTPKQQHLIGLMAQRIWAELNSQENMEVF